MMRAQAMVEVAIVFPILVVLTAAVVQFGFWMHAETVANAAVSEGARVAASRGGTLAQGQVVAQSTLRDGLGSSSAPHFFLSGAQSATSVELRVDGSIPSYFMADLLLPIHANVLMTKERFDP